MRLCHVLLTVFLQPGAVGQSSSSGQCVIRACLANKTLHTAGELQNLWAPPYDRETRPSLASALDNGNVSAPPDVIEAQFRVENLLVVDERNGQIKVLLQEKWRWKDERLQYTPFDDCGCFPMDVVNYDGSPHSKIWHPDVNFLNEVEVISVRGEYWRLYADGQVYWRRTTVKWLSCPFDFRFVPYDVQTCRTRAQVYRGNERTEILTFRPTGPGVLGPGGRSIGGAQEWTLTGLSGEVFDHRSVGEDDTALDIVIKFARGSAYYEIYIIVPTILIVCTSYCSFYIDRKAVPARVGLSITCVLVLLNMICGVRAMLPASIYHEFCTLLDFLFISSFFCLYAVVEYAACNWMMRMEDPAPPKGQDVIPESPDVSAPDVNLVRPTPGMRRSGLSIESPDVSAPDVNLVRPTPVRRSGLSIIHQLRNCANKSMIHHGLDDAHMVDFFSRIAFPLAYIIFCIVTFAFERPRAGDMPIETDDYVDDW